MRYRFDLEAGEQTESRLNMPPNSPRLYRKMRAHDQTDEFITSEELSGEDVRHEPPVSTGLDSKRTAVRTKWRRKQRRRLSGVQVVGLSFLIPFGILALAFILMGFFPFGERTPLTIDLYHQYAPFLAQLKDKMTHGFNLFYSWNGGLGNNFYALFAYYLSSPLNILLLVFPVSWVTEAVTLLTLLKVGAAGASFAYFLRNAFCIWGEQTVCLDPPSRKTRYSRTATSFAVVMTSSFFALSGFMLTYSWDIMWLDAIALMPLMMLGLHRLIRDGRFMTYVLSLALILLCNYYIALFICIFTVFYFPVCYFSLSPNLNKAQAKPGRHFLLRASQFAGASLLGAGISAILTIPTYLSLQLTSASTDQFPEVWSLRFTLFDFIGRHLPTMSPSIRDGLPNIYTGVLTFALIPLYIAAKHIRLGEKLLHLGLLVFMFISFNLNGLDFIWHGMHYPNQLPYRYSFVYSFLVLIICFRVLTQVRTFTPRAIATAFGGGILYAILAKVISPDLVEHTAAYIAIILLIVYMLITLSLVRRVETLRMTALLLSILCIAELCVNTFLTIYTINENEYYTKREDFNNDIPAVRQRIEELEKEDPSFWRMETVQQKTTNSPSLYNYRGFTIFSSTSYERTAKLMRALGYHGNNINSYKYTASTALLDSLFGIKYILDKNGEQVDPLLAEVDATEAGRLYHFDDALSVGYMMGTGLRSWEPLDRNPFRNQQDLLRAGGVSSDIYQSLPLVDSNSVGPEDVTEENVAIPSELGILDTGYNYARPAGLDVWEIKVQLVVPQDQHVYFFFDPDKRANFEVKYYEDDTHLQEEGTEITRVDINEQELVDAGYRRAGEVVTVKMRAAADGASNITAFAVGMDPAAYRRTMDELQSNQLQVTAFSDNYIEGEITATNSGDLFLTIPHDVSWQVLVDGQPGELEMAANGLSCIPLTAGYHTVAMTFIPPSFKTGLIISVLSLVILIVLFVINRKKHKGRKEFDPVYIDVMGLAREATDLPKRLRANEQDGVEAGVAAPQLFPNIEQQSDIGQQTDESQIDDGQLTTETDLAALDAGETGGELAAGHESKGNRPLSFKPPELPPTDLSAWQDSWQGDEVKKIRLKKQPLQFRSEADENEPKKMLPSPGLDLYRPQLPPETAKDYSTKNSPDHSEDQD